jgi:hypothetical protein
MSELNSKFNLNMTALDEIESIYNKQVRDKVIKPFKLFKKDKKTPTKKFLKYNRDLIKQGLTYNYIDETKLFKRSIKNGVEQLTSQTIKYDKRYKDKKVPLKKYQKLQTLGNVIIENNLNNPNDTSYIKKINKELKKTKSGGEVDIDLKKINLVKALSLVGANRKKGFYQLARVKGSPQIITLSSANRSKLIDYESLKGNQYSDREGSDNQFILNLDRNPILQIITRKVVKGEKPQGAFFKYYHKLNNLDLSRYEIFNSKPKKYINNCLYTALENGGLELIKLNQLRIFVRSGSVPCSKLNLICEKLDIKITLRKLRTNRVDIETKHYGSQGKNYDIGLLDNHYFIYEKTQITSWSLKNYDSIKNEFEWWKLDKSRRDVSYINSFKVIQTLLKRKEIFLESIPIEDVLDTQYFNDMINNDDLEYNEKDCLKENTVSTNDKTDNKLVYFDFETDTSTETHTPYLMCALNDENQKFSAIGEDCANEFIHWIKRTYGKECTPVTLIAHNLRYDYTFIFSEICCLKPILKGNSLMGGSGRLYVDKSRFIELNFMDSHNLISSKLSGFGSMFNLEQGKEIMPYSLYTTKNIEEQYLNKNLCLSFVKDEDKEQYMENMEKWNCIEGEELDIIEYSRRYCEIDCEVLKNGLETFRKWIKEITGLDVLNYCSMASLGLDYLISKDCFEDCFKMCGRPREFIQRCVVGGRCMTKDNKKWKVSGQIDDFDAVSLYPSAMNRMSGFLKGSPKVIKNKSFEWLKDNSDGFFVKVLCLNNPKINRGFPLLSNYNGEIRDFTNNTKNNEYYIDKTTYEDCVKYQGLEFKIICGYYYDEGRNQKINNVIKHLFNARIEAKKVKNPIQSIYKLLMNSCYGKCLLKPIESDTEMIYEKNFDKYLSYNYNFIKDIVDCGNMKIVKKIKTINTHYNNCYAGVEILSMSKRIMNEVICLGEDLGLNIYYQDTDSMHINSDEIKILSNEFKNKYGRDLIGKNMGQFHSDFDLEGASKNIHAVNSIFLGKKCYIDELVGEDKENKEVKGFHVRMKGVNLEGINHYTKKYNTDIMSVYNGLYENNTLPENRKFDLLAGGQCIKFKYNPDMSVSTVGEFSRGVNFNYEKGILC